MDYCALASICPFQHTPKAVSNFATRWNTKLLHILKNPRAFSPLWLIKHRNDLPVEMPRVIANRPLDKSLMVLGPMQCPTNSKHIYYFLQKSGTLDVHMATLQSGRFWWIKHRLRAEEILLSTSHGLLCSCLYMPFSTHSKSSF